MIQLFLGPFLSAELPPPVTPRRGSAGWPYLSALISLHVSQTFPAISLRFSVHRDLWGASSASLMLPCVVGYRAASTCWGGTLDLHCSSRFEILFFHTPYEALMWFLIVTWEFSRKEKERLTSQTPSCLPLHDSVQSSL